MGTAAIFAGLMGVAILNKPTITWQPYSEANLLAAQAQEKPVLLDFYADWCIPCLELDHITFADERVIRATENFVRIKVDLTRYDSPESEALRERFAVVGVPTLVFLDRNGEETRELRIVGFIGPDPFLENIRAAHETRSSPVENEVLPIVIPDRYSTAYTSEPASEKAWIVNGASLGPFMPGEPVGMPGREMPLMSGRSVSSLFIVASGTWPSTT